MFRSESLNLHQPRASIKKTSLLPRGLMLGKCAPVFGNQVKAPGCRSAQRLAQDVIQFIRKQLYNGTTVVPTFRQS